MNAADLVHDQLAEDALALFGVDGARRTYISHSENVTFRIEAQDRVMLLRLHAPMTTVRGRVWCEPATVRSELLWLLALSRDGRVRVQRPIASRSGDLIALVGGPVEPIVGSLLEWIPGDQLPFGHRRSSRQAEALGEILAHLHDHGATWERPAGFTRPSYGTDRLHAAMSAVRAEEREGVVESADCSLLEQALDRFAGSVMEPSAADHGWGLIHGDLNESNYVLDALDPDRIHPIDFASCGFGPPAFDLAGSMCHLDPPLRKHLFDGYARLREPPRVERIEAAFVMTLICNFGFWAGNDRPSLRQTLPFVARHHCRKLLDGERFLFTT